MVPKHPWKMEFWILFVLRRTLHLGNIPQKYKDASPPRRKIFLHFDKKTQSRWSIPPNQTKKSIFDSWNILSLVSTELYDFK